MNISISAIRKSIAHFIGRYHVVIFVVTVLGGLSIFILRLNSTIIKSTEPNGYTSKSNSVNFDQTTIDRIKKLKTRSESGGQLDLSSGRTNPFVE